ncbi:MAG: rod shape-determining protein MreD [Paracoccaceae bacterium]|nr:rod shape-determining protein MreD [Paracoccaceae bacterium]
MKLWGQMAERSATHIWTMRALYSTTCFAVILFHLLPLGQIGWITFSPDIILCITLAWVVRRPEYAPILLITAVALLADLLLMRVPGLWAALVVLLADRIGRQRHRMRSTGFGVEWLRVSVGIGMLFILERFALNLLFVDRPPLPASILQLLATLIFYPVVVGVSAGVFRVRKPALIETAASGRRA